MTDKKRNCGSCQLCCTLMPVADIELKKPALQRCKHLRFKKGCSIYENRPFSCASWSCAWLTNDLPSDMPRPDRCGYVVDPVPDTVTYLPENGDPSVVVPVYQVWIDPKRISDRGSLVLSNGFGSWLEGVFENGKGVLIRQGSRIGYSMFMYKGELVAGQGTLRPQPGQLKDAFTAFIR